MSRLVNDLISKGYLSSEVIIDAFYKVHRIEFIPDDLAAQAEADIPLPIGYGQTISQPMTVAFMLELLDPKPGQNILDVGSGSGWTTGLLSYIVGDKGKVTAMEIIEELCKIGEKNVEKFGFVKKGIAEFYSDSAKNGFLQNSPYDRILVSASVDEIPPALKQQLVLGGKMVIPVNNSIWYVEKKSEDDFHIEKFSGFAFVPFLKND
ncbi:MAG TPA: protein-L-isoaspartate O-methyltransferase [Candidatus Moranbacteria bacterium]|nr:protein-L-isoaspartate O-methyltransferase [Candidatus Moranbacteria bacterium]